MGTTALHVSTRCQRGKCRNAASISVSIQQKVRPFQHERWTGFGMTAYIYTYTYRYICIYVSASPRLLLFCILTLYNTKVHMTQQ